MTDDTTPREPEVAPQADGQPQPGPMFGFVETPGFRRWALPFLAGACVILFAVELVLPSPLLADAAKLPGKYAVAGLASISLAVAAAWAATVLRRRPDYYGDAAAAPPDADDAGDDWRAEERGR